MKHGIFLCFLRAFGKFSCEIRIKTGFLLFGSMRGVCLYFVAQCAFVPTRTVLAKCFSACLLINATFSAVFARIDWLNQFGTTDRSVFLFERLFQLFESVSCRLPESLCAAGRVDACRPCRAVFFLCLRLFAIVFACFVVYGVLRTAVASVRWAGGFLFRFWADDQTNWAVDGALPVVVFIRFSRRCAAILLYLDWLLCLWFRLLAYIYLYIRLFSAVFLCFSAFFAAFARLYYKILCFCNKC